MSAVARQPGESMLFVAFAASGASGVSGVDGRGSFSHAQRREGSYGAKHTMVVLLCPSLSMRSLQYLWAATAF